jgi:ParB family chromosome partitioning protein
MKVEEKEIELRKIEEPEQAVRVVMDDSRFEDLVHSIKEVGLINPLVVKKKGGSYELVAGHRRFFAVQRLGWDTVPCRVIEETDDGAELLKIHENLFREDISDYEEALFLDYLVRREGWEISKLAERIHRSEVYIQQKLQILKYPKILRDALADKKISFSQARVLCRFPKEDLEYYLKTAIENGATVRTLEYYLKQVQGRLEYEQRQKVEKKDDSKVTLEDIEEREVYCRTCDRIVDVHSVRSLVTCDKCYDDILAMVKELRKLEAKNGVQGNTGENG